MPGDVEKLLGGYASGTLTAEERQALFEAALQDQVLFDALAREEALREVLSDRAARTRLLAALERQRAAWYRFQWAPMPVRAVVAVAALSFAVVASYWTWHSHSQRGVTEVAALRPAAIPAAPPVVAEKGAVAAPAGKEHRPLARRLPSTSDAAHRNASGAPTAEPVAQPAQAGTRGTSGVVGSLVPAAPAPPPAPAPASPMGALGGAPPAPALAKGAAGPGPPPAASRAQAEAETSGVEVQAANSAVAVSGSVTPTLQSGAAGNNYRAARGPIMPALASSVAAPLRWTVLRRNAGGSFEPIEVDELHVGDTIELRLESAIEGEVSLIEGAPGGVGTAVLLPATQIAGGRAVVTPLIPPAGSGARVLTIRLTRAEVPPISTVVRLNYR